MVVAVAAVVAVMVVAVAAVVAVMVVYMISLLFPRDKATTVAALLVAVHLVVVPVAYHPASSTSSRP